MGDLFPTIRELRSSLAKGEARPADLAQEALSRSNRNAGRNTYLWQDSEWTLAEAARVEQMPAASGGGFDDGRSALWGLPIAVKDCFDLSGAPTSCGTTFYRDAHGVAERDSWLVENLRAAGAVITGKTHLHPLAYGITGENPEFGDCEQPDRPGSLTGGSSSGSAAAVQEGSAVAAIGTDTGGSIRVPAALCGLAGYRASLGRGNWRGGAHLAESFDTMGWLFRDLEDAPLLAAPFAPTNTRPLRKFTRFAYVEESFLHDCEPEVVASQNALIHTLRAMGLDGRVIDTEWWAQSSEIFAPIQASEAAKLHAGHFDRFEKSIGDRLKWGASLSEAEVAALRVRHAEFRARMDDLFAEHELVLLPCAPVSRLAAGADHSQTRARLLRYTTPFSLAGNPAITIPCENGGIQIGAARDSDESLLALAAEIGAARKRAI